MSNTFVYRLPENALSGIQMRLRPLDALALTMPGRKRGRLSPRKQVIALAEEGWSTYWIGQALKMTKSEVRELLKASKQETA